MRWVGPVLLQGIHQANTELGYIAYEEQTNSYVIWLKDYWGHAVRRGGYVRGDTFSTLEEGMSKGPTQGATFLFHLMWQQTLAETADSTVTPKPSPPQQIDTAQRVPRWGALGRFGMKVAFLIMKFLPWISFKKCRIAATPLNALGVW